MTEQAVNSNRESSFLMSVDDRIIQCVVLEVDGHLQANIHAPQESEPELGVWALFEGDTDNVSIANALAPAVRATYLEPNVNITHLVRGSIMAGTAVVPQAGEEPVSHSMH